MRIRRIKIAKWRHFEDIELTLDEQASLVCIVGANGTGKSHMLELIGACAHRLGLSPGIETARGNPFDEPHDFQLQFFFAKGVSAAIDDGLSGEPGFAEWDRTITLESSKSSGTTIDKRSAGGIIDAATSTNFTDRVVRALGSSQDVHFVSLDSDRAYPKRAYNIHEIAQAYETDWEGLEFTRGRSFKPTSMLYDEWIKYFLAKENQAGTQLIQETRKALKKGVEPPVFRDHFSEYSTSLQKVLPHVVFIGVDPKARTLMFDTTGLELSFHQLSGGEREIAFLIGQVDRFGLREGIFLIDEPELHLNADLIRTWVAHLTSTVSVGQIWLATHSLEAVEAAGQHATFILERNERTKKVDSLARLDARPVLSALSRAVGTPAFSISQLVFVFVEGEEGVGERERFRNLAESAPNIRLMECGSGNEVVRRVATTKALAKEAETTIRIGGVIDRDFKSDVECESISKDTSVFVLPVHEVENLFLHPGTLAVILKQNGITSKSPSDLIRNASDLRAGSWVFQHAFATKIAKTLPEISPAAKEATKGLSWCGLDESVAKAIERITGLSGFDDENKRKLEGLLNISFQAYSRRRSSDDLWKHCEGKQVIQALAREAGFARPQALEAAALAVWTGGAVPLPDELVALRRYLASL